MTKSFQAHFSTIICFLIIGLTINCGNDEEEITFDESLTFEFGAVIDGESLEFNSSNYTTAAGNEITIDRIKIYISNLKLRNSDTGDEYVDEDGYHLVSLNDQALTYSFTLDELRSDLTFDQISFAIGIDIERNFSLDNVGDLDPTNDMAWNWDTGYKFFLMEGSFFPRDDPNTRGIVIHIGQDRNYVEQVINIDQTLNIQKSGTLKFNIDALAPLNGPNIIDLNDKSTFKVDVDSDKIAQNYASGMISLTSADF